MHLEEKRFFGYICPECGSAVRDERSAFALYAAAARIACECGKSELRAELQGDKAELYVPCGICGKTHHARCTAQQLLQGKGIALSCPDCKQLICYIGEHSMVYFISHYPMLYYIKFSHLCFGRSIFGRKDEVLVLIPIIFVCCTWLVPYIERIPWLSGRWNNKETRTKLQVS